MEILRPSDPVGEPWPVSDLRRGESERISGKRVSLFSYRPRTHKE